MMRIVREFYYVLKTLVYILKSSSFKKKNKFAHHSNVDSCYIFGNGPSLKKILDENIEIFTDKFILVCNDFALSEYYVKLKPRYYLLSDPTYFNKYNNIEHKKQTDHLYEIINQVTDWDIKFIIPYTHFETNYLQNIFKANKNISIQFYNTTALFCNQRLKFKLFDWGLGKPIGYNILVSSIYISIFSGFSTVYIYGADHSWLSNLYVNDSNEVCLKLDNFYLDPVQNYNVWKGDSGVSFTMPVILNILSNVFNSYFELNDYARSKNIKIFNCTKGSYIDGFPRLIK